VKVLFVHSTDQHATEAGGLISMRRLRRSLREQGVESQVLCATRNGPASEAETIPGASELSGFEAPLRRITRQIGLNDIHRLGTFKIPQLAAYQRADVLDFHCIHGGFFNYLALPSLTTRKPAVLTLHDMWPFTGHCANSQDCMRWVHGCGHCPYPQAYPSVSRDATNLEWRLKSWAFGHSRFSVVAPSKWMVMAARQSFLGRFPIFYIPHGIDTNVFRPVGRACARAALGIAPNSRVLGFACTRIDDPKTGAPNRAKGVDLLIDAVRDLPDHLKTNTVLLLMGQGGERLADLTGVPVIGLGYVSSDRMKAIAYSAADVFISASRGESFGLVALESMSCGTPVVGFDVGGLKEVLRPGIAGAVASAISGPALCDAVVQMLENDVRRARMAKQGRDIAVAEHGLDIQARRYLQVYQDTIAERGSDGSGGRGSRGSDGRGSSGSDGSGRGSRGSDGSDERGSPGTDESATACGQ
jgi:glycosyltransferase involved in cell wall biosynthesis